MQIGAIRTIIRTIRVIGMATTTIGVVTTIREVGTITIREIGGKAFKGPQCINNRTIHPHFHLKVLVSPTTKWGELRSCVNR